jgi:hypothetical protein
MFPIVCYGEKRIPRVRAKATFKIQYLYHPKMQKTLDKIVQ